MLKKGLFVLPAAMVPGALFLLERAAAADTAKGLVVGGLIGLSLFGLYRQRRCLATELQSGDVG